MSKKSRIKAERGFMEGSSISNIKNFRNVLSRHRLLYMFLGGRVFFQWTQRPNCKGIQTNW